METVTEKAPACTIRGPEVAGQPEILTPEAMEFLEKLDARFEMRRLALLSLRRVRQHEIDGGRRPDFLQETAKLRRQNWKVANIPADLRDRRVEITGPVDRKMVINALNSGANVFMADFEDANSPTWSNNIEGQVNLRDAVAGTIAYDSPEGKSYRLNEKIAVLMVRPRGWHLVEKHFLVNGHPISASLFDFGLFFFHNARALLTKGSGPYFYLPKMENHLEARLWNDVFRFAQHDLGIPKGSIRATVLIETILAAFEMDEILYELRDHSAGLNCGRWDYIFSFIKKLRARPDALLPDRQRVTMTVPFLDSYVRLLIETCHRRGIHAMGGMAAQIPIKNDPEANENAMEKVRQDKLREVRAGHDGTWVAHPALVPIAREIFDEHMKGANQIDSKREPAVVGAEDLLAVPRGAITAEGLRWNINVGLLYLESWLRGFGCVPIYNLMEDAATAEICRSQVWQWVKHGAKLESGEGVTGESVTQEMALDVLTQQISEETARTLDRAATLESAGRLLKQMIVAEDFPEFLTLAAYEEID